MQKNKKYLNVSMFDLAQRRELNWPDEFLSSQTELEAEII